MTHRFIESIKILDGQVFNLPLHIERMNKAMNTYFDKRNFFNPLRIPLSAEVQHGLHKCRLVYGEHGIEEIKFEPYQRRSINRYLLVRDDNLSYSYKYINREDLYAHKLFLDDDEEVIFIKHGMLTDATYYNLALFDGSNWYTPKHPLLHGVMRRQLLNEGKIIEKVILLDDLAQYEKISFINALNSLEELVLML